MMSPIENPYRVAIFEEFLDAFARIPRAEQKKVNQFLRMFREDPTSPGIHYEGIHEFADPNLRTVRIGLAYRAIVLKPATGNVFVLLWVDHHDEAMRWAQSKRVAIHPETGSLQVIPAELPPSVDIVEVQERAIPLSEEPPLFVARSDSDLLRLGVPEALLLRVRTLRSTDALEEARTWLPPEAFEALYWLSEGEGLEDVEKAMAVRPVAQVDTTDFGAALDRDATRRRFVVVDNDAALEAMLDSPLDKWRIFLHPSQRKLVERNWNGPVRVLGGAGTGKTVVAMHRAAWLATHVFTAPGDRILFTTFTRNLAADIEANLTRLCNSEARARIEVIHLDKWAAGLLKRAGYRYEICWWGGDARRLPPEKQPERLWGQALALAPPESGAGAGLPTSFYRDEWELVVQPEGCENWDDYRQAPRAGRGVRLSRTQRKEIWPVFQEYRSLLEKHGLREPEDALRDAAALIRQGKVRVNARAILVDEAQDMSTHAFALIRAAVPDQQANDLFIVGDGHQRIYRKRVVLSQAGVDIRGRGQRLRINYRTTDEIRRFGVSLLEGTSFDDMDAGDDSTWGYRSLVHGEAPEVRVLKNFAAEVDAIVDWLGEDDLSRACLVARTGALVTRYSEALTVRGVAICPVHRSAPDNPGKPGLRVATMHRVKGLEFDRMVVAGVSQEYMPLETQVERSADIAVRRETVLMERALLYVAVTRARRAALLTAHGKVSGWVGGRERNGG